MADNFLNNDNYYNKGGLNGKPKEPRPMPSKGQSTDNRYELIFKQLMHECSELRKYIINICELLDIDTSQSVLGANCLEFYAVLSSTANDKINYMEGYIRTLENARDEFGQELKRKEQECEELKQWKKGAENLFKAQIDNPDKIINRYKQALDEIENYCKECNLKADFTACDILNIINKVEEQ